MKKRIGPSLNSCRTPHVMDLMASVAELVQVANLEYERM